MIVAGIDEAGRGAVIGPLVICGISFNEKDVNQLRKMRVRDSKEISPRMRERYAKAIEKIAKDIMILKISPCIIDNRKGPAGGKATAGSKTKGIRKNADGSYCVLLGPDTPPKGWEANHVQTLPGRGWFPCMRMYGATEKAFNDA